MDTREEHDSRWDIHTERQIAASKGGAAAVTILNSGSWLALLSQANKLVDVGVALPILFWGLGALFGTSVWLIIYRSTTLQWLHDLDRTDTELHKKLDFNVKIGFSFAILSLLFFAAGVFSLACSVW